MENLLASMLHIHLFSALDGVINREQHEKHTINLANTENTECLIIEVALHLLILGVPTQIVQL